MSGLEQVLEPQQSLRLQVPARRILPDTLMLCALLSRALESPPIPALVPSTHPIGTRSASPGSGAGHGELQEDESWASIVDEMLGQESWGEMIDGVLFEWSCGHMGCTMSDVIMAEPLHCRTLEACCVSDTS